MRHLHKLVSGSILAGLLLAGCGQVSPVASDVSALQAAGLSVAADGATTQGTGGPAGFGKGGPGGPGGHDRRGPGGMPGDVPLGRLNLTADQQTQVKAIFDKYKPAQPAQQPADIRTLLTADTVDATALRTAIAAQQQTAADMRSKHADMQVELRAVLTDDQRATWLDQVKNMPKPPAPPADATKPNDTMKQKLADKLKLSTDQQAALDALMAKSKPSGTPPDIQAALISFIQTGDKSALLALPAPTPPVDELVAAATILSVDQRKEVFGRGPGFGPGGPGGPGGFGPGGPGGIGGHLKVGGPGGFGPGGFGPNAPQTSTTTVGA